MASPVFLFCKKKKDHKMSFVDDKKAQMRSGDTKSNQFEIRLIKKGRVKHYVAMDVEKLWSNFTVLFRRQIYRGQI